ncbi:hypothetical protein F5141DRAFT_1205111 [Pisolithus sp. B1]|nr:hypothetical protein F5141DRAFT_1205111 [Pisolithus sp. B1]
MRDCVMTQSYCGHFGQQIHAYAQHVTNSEASSKNCWCSDNLMTRRSKWSSATCCKTIQIKKIGGVFSRMTSYVFNNLSTGRSGGINFSDVVAHANLSKTAALYVYCDSLEPNPVDDLDGADVARKLTVLSSMIDPSMLPLLPQGYKSLDARSLIPPELGSLNGGDEFIQRLPTLRSCERWLQWRGVFAIPPKIHAFATSLGIGQQRHVPYRTRQVPVTVRTLRWGDVFLMRSANWKGASECNAWISSHIGDAMPRCVLIRDVGTDVEENPPT